MKKALTIALLLLLGASAAAAYQKAGLLDGIAPGPDGRIDVVTVFPHQDDESFWPGGTLHLLKQDPRVRLTIVCLTLGEKSGAKDALHISGERLAGIRIKELQLAAQVYQADGLVQLDYPDQGLQAAGDANVTAKIVEALKGIGPEVIITYGPDGFTNHIDHRACCRDVTAAFPDTGAQRLYYVTAPPWVTRLTMSHNPQPIMPTIKVDIRPMKKLKMLALKSHASQTSVAFSMGGEMGLIKLLNHEWFVVAADRPAPAAH
jgi:LmbE family N-acetylglucosaminyl deacetylase